MRLVIKLALFFSLGLPGLVHGSNWQSFLNKVNLGQVSLVDKALKSGVNVRGSNILLNAIAPKIFIDHIEQAYLLRRLLEEGADVNAKDKNGQTVLHGAVFLQSTPCIEVLLEYGADVRIADNFYKIPLDYVTEETKLMAPVGVELLNYAYSAV